MLAYNFGLLTLPRMRSAWTMAPTPRTTTRATTTKPQAPPCNERMAPMRMITHPARPIFIAVSADASLTTLGGSFETSGAVEPTTTGAGSSVSSVSFAALALSSNPPMVHPRYRFVLRLRLSIQPLFESGQGDLSRGRQRPGAASRHSSSASSSVLRKRRPATAPASAIMESAGTTSKPGR